MERFYSEKSFQISDLAACYKDNITQDSLSDYDSNLSCDVVNIVLKLLSDCDPNLSSDTVNTVLRLSSEFDPSISCCGDESGRKISNEDFEAQLNEIVVSDSYSRSF
ncbi:hypothetical protein HOI26_05670 [Candidatus Woesearchaeota archaeon]|jgi:hypothetical protein|nr:hypothetical protein [Candidatus Woesearchaeota archaeon]MBT5740555.1 hypothetical protein [Candidatus Woesearchaeota archaeon]